MGKHDQARGQFVHVIYALYAVTIKQRFKAGIGPGNCTGMRYRKAGRELGLADLDGNDGNFFCVGFFKCCNQALRVARRFHEQADNTRLRQLEREVEVLVHGDDKLLARRYGQVETNTFVDIDDAGHAGAGMADQGDIAAARVLAGIKTAGPDAIMEVVKAHGVTAANEQSGFTDFGANTLFQWRVGIFSQDECRDDRCGPGPVRNGLVDGCFYACITDGEDDVVNTGRQIAERGEAESTVDILVMRVDRKELSSVFTFQQVLDDPAADRTFSYCRADDRNGARTQQRVETVRHVRWLVSSRVPASPAASAG